MKRVLSVTLGVLIVIGGIIGGVVISKDVVELRKVGTSIVENQQKQSRVFDEKAKLREDIAKEGQAISEIPDSLKASRSGKAIKSSMIFAKTEARLDQENARLKKAIRKLGRDKLDLGKRVKKGGILLAGVELLLIIGLIVVRKVFA